MNKLLLPENIKLMYNTFSNKKKERFDIILEPLQAIIQLGLLSFCPYGTKITINNNILELQLPTYTQGIIRWYNNDNKDDLFYLFNACKRFGKNYEYLKQYKEVINKDDDIIETNLYDILVTNAKEGLNKLLQTYNNANKVSLLHTLEMYKLLLDNPNIFDNINNTSSNIENIFSSIKEIYSIEELKIIHNIFHLLIKNNNDNYYMNYINSINSIFINKNALIRKWISNNIIF